MWEGEKVQTYTIKKFQDPASGVFVAEYWLVPRQAGDNPCGDGKESRLRRFPDLVPHRLD